jgi:hypothetical protein
MSQTETHFGKLRKIETRMPVEEWCQHKCYGAGITEIPSYYSDWTETFLDKFHKKFFIVDNTIWEVIEHIENEDGEDIDVMIPNSDGTITFVQQFYNGGTCLSECIENGLKELNKKLNIL